ncbi:putative S-acyltransferase [Acorus calamus]|uniref:S-acyltransferase n=1 Tax=Acorus calamus TaxID=4465 RepID=A0AAV9DA65_ACOCL|nr:putative S-acyltransferase [Acorus calamus]
MKRRNVVSLPIALVLSVIGFIYYATVFVVIDGWMGLRTSDGLMNAAAFTALAVMSVLTYAMAIVKDPGHVPSSFVPDVEDPNSPLHEIKRKYHEGVRAMWLAEKVGNVYQHPYDLGIYENLVSHDDLRGEYMDGDCITSKGMGHMDSWSGDSFHYHGKYWAQTSSAGFAPRQAI